MVRTVGHLPGQKLDRNTNGLWTVTSNGSTGRVEGFVLMIGCILTEAMLGDVIIVQTSQCIYKTSSAAASLGAVSSYGTTMVTAVPLD